MAVSTQIHSMNLEQAQRAWLIVSRDTHARLESLKRLDLEKGNADFIYAEFREVNVMMDNLDQLENHIKALTGGNLY